MTTSRFGRAHERWSIGNLDTERCDAGHSEAIFEVDRSPIFSAACAVELLASPLELIITSDGKAIKPGTGLVILHD
jgi:hypothetical protein